MPQSKFQISNSRFHNHGALSMRLRLFGTCSLLAIFLFIASLAVAQCVHSANAPALLLANELGPQVDPAKYLVSEKYDGVRALWDGKELRFRSGRPVTAPPWFMAKLSLDPLDGELWLGRRRFEELPGIV